MTKLLAFGEIMLRLSPPGCVAISMPRWHDGDTIGIAFGGEPIDASLDGGWHVRH
jgi:hypothetical protein